MPYQNCTKDNGNAGAALKNSGTGRAILAIVVIIFAAFGITAIYNMSPRYMPQSSTVATAQDPYQDTTPVTQCDGLPSSLSLDNAFSWSQTANICRQMLRTLDGIRRKDIANFSLAIWSMRNKGYDADYLQVAKELIEIIRLRGLYNKPDRWKDANDVIYGTWVALNGSVSAKQVIAILRNTDEQRARALSDDGLRRIIVYAKQQNQSGN